MRAGEMFAADVALGDNESWLSANEMTTPWEREARRRSPRRGAEALTVKRLAKAVADVVRYDSWSARRRTVLTRCVFKARRDDAAVVADVETVFGSVVVHYAKAGVIGGARCTKREAGSLHLPGVSTRHMREKQKPAGSERDSVEHAPGAVRDQLAFDATDMDLQAELVFARQHRPGPFRATAERHERRAKDPSVLGRAGFAVDVARRVIDADNPDALITQETPS